MIRETVISHRWVSGWGQVVEWSTVWNFVVTPAKTSKGGQKISLGMGTINGSLPTAYENCEGVNYFSIIIYNRK